jgi:hypothetical protein
VPNWFDQIRLSAEGNRLPDLVGIVHARAHDNLCSRVKLSQHSQRFQAIHSRHLHIQQHHSRRTALLDALQRLFAIAGNFHVITIEFQQETEVILQFDGVFYH